MMYLDYNWSHSKAILCPIQLLIHSTSTREMGRINRRYIVIRGNTHTGQFRILKYCIITVLNLSYARLISGYTSWTFGLHICTITGHLLTIKCNHSKLWLIIYVQSMSDRHHCATLHWRRIY